ncbi:hypothetical protein HanXRQr2_Chr15g0693951 [Helianthus annuus]|uniref:Uncharacterized protein n=1 Tax=Helianthus annuus TaxID=4232 RepID=A0A251S8N0_HELAN|nr:hypothetical protein HanXRQr2_Chr15g0693951 [Helianthus annuus]KAJ0831328.1 hypothetical protein HanPSC8_Chr15g0665821 [Helianthus annuus]
MDLGREARRVQLGEDDLHGAGAATGLGGGEFGAATGLGGGEFGAAAGGRGWGRAPYLLVLLFNMCINHFLQILWLSYEGLLRR